MWQKCLFVFMCIRFTLAKAGTTYRAGVVDTTKDNLNFNNNIIHKIISSASNQNLDILILPSLNFNHFGVGNLLLEQTFSIPEVTDHILPCSSELFIEPLRTLSCAARDASMYIVTNIEEKQLCDQIFTYMSTNLVFNRNGHIISVNRKPLRNEVGCNSTLTDVLTFETDFGVKFSHLQDEDLVLKNPEFLIENGVKNYVLPSRVSYTAFMDGIQYYSAWVYTTSTNLLVSGTKDTSGDSGSGIFSGKNGAKVHTIVVNNSIKLVVGELEKEPIDTNTTDLTYNTNYLSTKSRQYVDLSGFSTKHLNLELSNTGLKEKLCDGGLCCEFYVKTTKHDDTKIKNSYLLAVFDGGRQVLHNHLRLQICSLLVCIEPNENNCLFGINKNSTQVTFEKISISGNFPQNNSIQFPATLTDDILPLNPSQFQFNTVKSTQHVSVLLTEKQTDLVAFGIFGRDFSKDIFESKSLDESTKSLDESTKYLDENTIKLLTSDEFSLGDYLWVRLKVLIFVVSIYVLEQI